MSEIIARMAEAWKASHYGPAQQPDDWLERDMRAVLSAMREPTEAMIEAGASRQRQHWEPSKAIKAGWHAMIDEAAKAEA